VNCFSGFSVFVVNLWDPLCRIAPLPSVPPSHAPGVIEITYRHAPAAARAQVADAEVPKTTSIATATSSCVLPALCGRQAARSRTTAAANRAKIPKKTPETPAKHSGEPHERPPHASPKRGFRAAIPLLPPRLGHRACGYSSDTGNRGWRRLRCCRCGCPARAASGPPAAPLLLTAIRARVRLRDGSSAVPRPRCHQRLHRVPCSVAKRPAKANPVHAGSLASASSGEARFHPLLNCRCGGLHPGVC